jgi:hypothetical protein
VKNLTVGSISKYSYDKYLEDGEKKEEENPTQNKNVNF